jgi:hypothetical protein
MNETERQALAERITLDQFGRYSTNVGIVQTVIDLLDSEGRLTEPPKMVELSDLWANVSVSREDLVRLADEVETWQSVMTYLSNPLGPEKIHAIREVRNAVSAWCGFTPALKTSKLVVDVICIRHGWSSSSWQGKS